MSFAEDKFIVSWKWAWGFLGALTTAVAFISFVQQLGDIPLRELPMRYLVYYRGYVNTLTGWIPLPFGWKIASWYADLMIIAVAIKATYNQALLISPVWKSDDGTSSLSYKLLVQMLSALDLFVKSLVAPITIIYYIVILFTTFILTRDAFLVFMYQMGTPHSTLNSMYELRDPQIRWLKTYGFLLVNILIASIVFFLVSAKWK